jgi:hypothetical protein
METTSNTITHEFEDVREDTLRWFTARVDGLNKVANKIGNGGFAVTTVETQPAMDRAEAARVTSDWFWGSRIMDNRPAPYTGACLTVTITGTLPQVPGGWQVLAAVDHEATDDGFRNIVRGYEDGIVAEWLTAEPNCDHCGADRNRRYTVVVRDADGNVRQVGKSCLRDFVGHQSIETLMSLATCWGDFISDSADPDEDRVARTERTLPAGAVVAAALAATKAFGYQKADSDHPTRRTVQTLLTEQRNQYNDHIFAGCLEAIDTLGGPQAVGVDVAAAIQWVTTQDGTSDYMTNMATIFSSPAIDVKRLGFAVSLASVWNREQQRVVERNARAEAEAARKADATDAPEGRVEVEGVIVATKTYESDFGTTEKMTVLADAGFKVFVTIPNSIAYAERNDDGSYTMPAGRGDRVRFTATFERSNDDATFAFGKRPAKAEIVARVEEVAA